MDCVINGMKVTITGWTSGNGACANNPSKNCIATKNTGAAPPNEYYTAPSTDQNGTRANGRTQSRRTPPFYGARRMYPVTNGQVDMDSSTGSQVEFEGVIRDNFMTHYCPPGPGKCNEGCLTQTHKPTIDTWNSYVDSNNGAVITVK
jgi:hypothetical protein